MVYFRTGSKMVSISRLVKHGNSLYVAIPPKLRRALSLHRGDTLLVAIVDGKLVLRRVEPADLMRLTDHESV